MKMFDFIPCLLLSGVIVYKKYTCFSFRLASGMDP